MKKNLFLLLIALIVINGIVNSGCSPCPSEEDPDEYTYDLSDEESGGCTDEWRLFSDDDDEDDDDSSWWDDDDDDESSWWDDDDDDDDEDYCSDNLVPATCNSLSDIDGTLSVLVTADSMIRNTVVKLYTGSSVETGILVDEAVASGSSVTFSGLNVASEYSAKIEYEYGEDTIIAIDGTSFETESDNYCDIYGYPITCYSADNAELDLRFDIKAFKEFKEGENDNCFIATAAYGSKWTSEVKTLRKFRDDWLMTNTLGRDLVDTYYRYSPPIARFIKKSEKCKALVRYILTPVVSVVKQL